MGLEGIILAGTYRWNGAAFESLTPRPLLPVAQAPLIAYSLRWIGSGHPSRITVCLNEDSRRVRDHLSDGSHLGVKLEYCEDASPRGAAGCARDVALAGDARTFLISDGTVIPMVDQEQLLADHRASGAALTVVVHRDDHADGPAAPWSPAGIYVAERRVFDFVSEAGFQDIKENLVPRLHGAGLKVLTHPATACCPHVVDARTYLSVSHWMISRVAREHGAADGWNALDSGHGEVLAHPTARVDPTARLLGPILLGPGVKVKAHAAIVGPASIGADCTIAERAVVSRSITWERCTVEENAFLDACVLADDAYVEPGADVFGSVVTAATPRSKPAVPAIAAPSREDHQPALQPWTLPQAVSRPR